MFIEKLREDFNYARIQYFFNSTHYILIPVYRIYCIGIPYCILYCCIEYYVITVDYTTVYNSSILKLQIVRGFCTKNLGPNPQIRLKLPSRFLNQQAPQRVAIAKNYIAKYLNYGNLLKCHLREVFKGSNSFKQSFECRGIY
jgi:hypothetical protein